MTTNAHEKALVYLRARWPDAEWDDVRNKNDLAVAELLRAAEQDQACAECQRAGGRRCGGKMVGTVVRGEYRGRPSYEVRFRHCPMRKDVCRTPYEALVAKSGLSCRQRGQTFEAFNTACLGSSVLGARLQAMAAAKDGKSWLTLGGVRGVGKSHLATAIALSAMRQGKQAYFRLVPELLDDLRAGFERGDYIARMKFLKTVPCLVLDDLGKEHSTDAADDYLYQIIDSRYREDRQVIVTTNARSKEELASWGRTSYLAPLISRMDEMGDWVFINDAEDYRARMGQIRRVGAEARTKRTSLTSAKVRALC